MFVGYEKIIYIEKVYFSLKEFQQKGVDVCVI